VLFGLFLCFRFFPKWLVNLLLSGYITLLGAFAINAVALPFVAKLFSEETQHKVSLWVWTKVDTEKCKSSKAAVGCTLNG
jgi:minor histocompatibility antigen H13